MYSDQLPDYHPYNTPIVKAAFEVAQKAHQNAQGLLQVRKAKNGMEKYIPYICHPVMVVKLLEKLGRADEINIAIALLHDALEDNRIYELNPSMLRMDLEKAMENLGLPAKDAEAITDKIYANCIDMCNPSTQEMNNDKRAYQTDHIVTMLPRAKLIKMLDQTASALEDVWFEYTSNIEKQKQFFTKALDLNKSGAKTGDEYCKLAGALFSQVFNRFREIVNAKSSEERAQLRQNFDVDTALQKAKERMPITLTPTGVSGFEIAENRVASFLQTMVDKVLGAFSIVPSDQSHTRAMAKLKTILPGFIDVTSQVQTIHIDHPALMGEHRVAHGVASVGLAQGKSPPEITSFTLISPRTSDGSVDISKLNKVFVAALESLDSNHAVNIGDTEIAGISRLVRRYSFDTPVPLAKFLEAATLAERNLRADNVKANVVDWRIYGTLKAMDRSLQVPLPKSA